MVFNCIFAFGLVLGAVFASIRQFQMLQLNSYFAVRYLRWYKDSFGLTRLCYILFAFLIITAVNIALHFEELLLVGIVSLLVLSITAIRSFIKNKHSIKPLVVTARVKRMFTAEVLVLLAVAVLSVALKGLIAHIFTALLCLLAFLPEALTLISLVLMKPIEKLISQYYINDAKKILNSKKDLTVIGVTGSYGKTSVKFILGRILSEKYNTLVTPENYNTPMGIVITVRRDLKPQTQVFVCEMGAKRKGDILENCKIANPNMCVITSIGPQHLDTFGNIETIVSTKFELADWVEKRGGKSFLNTDNQYIKDNAQQYNFVSYGTHDCNCLASDISYSELGLKVKIDYKGYSFTVNSKLLGQHNALNIAAATAVALELGLTPKEIIYAVSKLQPIEHRLQLKPYLNGATLIDDAYNSNPEGCLEAVRVLGCFNGKKKILVTPGLVELGEKEYELNRSLGEEAAKQSDIIILVGKKRSVPIAEGIRSQGFNEDNLFVVSSFKEAVTFFAPMCDSNTVILFENDLPDNYLE